jgi:hypothetical protein
MVKQLEKHTEIIMENTSDFSILVINKGKLENLDWNDPNYISKIFKLNLTKSVTVNKDNFLLNVGKILETDKYYDIGTMVQNEVIGEEPYYLYEMLYIDLSKHKEYCTDTDINNLATLVNTNGETVCSNAIILKTYLPSLSDSMVFESVTSEDLQRILYHRGYTKVVLYRNYEYVEDNIANLESFAETFFEGEFYKKIEIAFLSHNINIWYVHSIEKEERFVCGNIINEPVEKCIWFTMNTVNNRGNLTLDEVKKIIFLSTKLDNYKPDIDWMEQRLDNLGRLIIKNKYRVLDDKYNIYK